MLRLIIPALTIKQIAKFWARIDTSPGQGPYGTCWEWTRYRDKDGYGYVRFGQHMYRPHRIAYKLYYREEPGEDAMHSCDNRGCCHPLHISSGTQGDNIRDMFHKGRSYSRVGEGNPTSFLTARMVLGIRKRIGDGESVNGSDFGISASHFYAIKHRRIWKHI